MPSKKTGRKTKHSDGRRGEVAEKRERLDVQAASTSVLERKRENDDEVIRRVREMKTHLFPSNNNTIGQDGRQLAPSPTINLLNTSPKPEDEMPKLLQTAKEAGNELAEAFRYIADQYN